MNQVRFSRSLGVLASSGVEKIVKLWGRIDEAKSGAGGTGASPRREAIARDIVVQRTKSLFLISYKIHQELRIIFRFLN